MRVEKLHLGEPDIDDNLVRSLLAMQFPDLASHPLDEVQSAGTVNVIYRLGEDLCVRLPRLRKWSDSLEKELTWLPRIAGRVSLGIPEPVGRGEAGGGYPFTWAIYRWLPGESLATDQLTDQSEISADLARFVLQLQALEPTGAPMSGRKPLVDLDEMTRTAIRSAGDQLDRGRTMAAWEEALASPAWDGVAVWHHCDLLPPNLLVDDGRLTAVLDFGSVGVGDPALDVVPAWSVFDAHARMTFRTGLEVDAGTWARARGYALHQALLIIPYYAKTNPGFVDMALRTVRSVLDDLEGSGAQR
jgi:aminoglycoside phosphotransferase (APT) family kinase protein